MSRKNFSMDTRDGRAAYAAQVKDARLAVGLRQEDLAHEARISRTTLIDIEAGRLVPQAGTLQRILDALGIDTAEHTLDHDTQTWVGMIGGMLQALPDERRARAGQAAVNAIAAEASRPNVGDVTEDDIHVTPEGPKKGYTLAARRGQKKANQPYAE